MKDVSPDSFKRNLDFHYDWQCPEADKIRLLWAKKHFKDDPMESYFLLRNTRDILAKEGKSDNEIEKYLVKSVIAGLKLRESSDEYKRKRALSLKTIGDDLLNKVYSRMPFGAKIDIAKHLKDEKKIKELSRQANKRGDNKQAYDLWFDAQGDLDTPYINLLRKGIIDMAIKQERLWIVNDKDSVGQGLVFDRAINIKGLEEDSYKVTWRNKDENRLPIARGKVLETFGTERALRKFLRPDYSDEKSDEIGIKYVLGLVAEKYGVDSKELMNLVKT